MIPQSLTSPLSLERELSQSGSDKVFDSTKSQNAKIEGCTENRLAEPLKNSLYESEESIVHWKQKNIKDGFVIVDEAQLSKLIKREPIEKYYKLEQEPFAKGVFASVRKCQSIETGECYAAKFTNRDRYGEDCSTEIYHEIALLSLCGSAPRVIQIHDVFETVNEIIIVMQYAPGGDLQTIIDEDLVPFESEVMSFIRQTVEGLDYLHRRRIAHLDIKPQNIVMMGDYPNCEIKLCDFEISRVILEGKDIRELLGTPDYVAPEILHYEPITFAADMWSLGVTTYVLLTGFSPFGGETDQETFCNISKADVDFPDDLFKDISNEAIDFLKRLLIKNPKARLTAAACLKHPWLNSKPQTNKTDVTEPVLTLKNESNAKYEDVPMGSDCQSPKEEIEEPTRDVDAILRKYLSKSRESLFDRVVQKHNNCNLKKNTIKNHRFRKTRMCKSQMSLISKSQEKLLAGEALNAPSRSIEKLYGLRSLSKSQEVLNLYKSGGILASQENLNLVSEMIKSKENLLTCNNESDPNRYRKLMRATTADLGVLQQRNKPCRMYSYSSTTSLSSFTVNTPEDEGDEDDDERQYIIRRDSVCDSGGKPNTDETFTLNDTKKIPDKQSNAETNSVMKEIEELENRKKLRKNLENYGEEEEPRFTVAQLITAFNKHQEIVTKTSLEVTMSAQERKTKIPPIIPYKSKSTFPTGPTALRLFIPDIDLVSMPKKFTPRYKMCFSEYRNTCKEKSPSPKDQEESNTSRSPTYNLNSSNLSLNSIINSSAYHSTCDDSIYNISNKCNEPQKKKSEVGHKYNQEDEKSQSLQRRHKSSSPGVEQSRMETHRTCSSENQDVPKREKYYERHEDTAKKRSPTPNRKLGVCRSVDRSPIVTRKTPTIERSPVSQRQTCSRNATRSEDAAHKKSLEHSSQYKIVGIGEKNSSRKSSGVSYKIEFNSPVVKRKFPLQNMTIKGTISSNLKECSEAFAENFIAPDDGNDEAEVKFIVTIEPSVTGQEIGIT